MKEADKEDKVLDHRRRKEKRIKQKMKWKTGRGEEEDGGEDDLSESDREVANGRDGKKAKLYFDSDSDGGDGRKKGGKGSIIGQVSDNVTLAEQEALALKILSSMHS